MKILFSNSGVRIPLTFILFFLPLIISCSSGEYEKEVEDLNLRGNVKSIEIVVYDYNKKTNTFKLDRITSVHFSKDKKFEEMTTQTFRYSGKIVNERNLQTHEVYRTTYSNGEKDSYSILKLDEKNQRVTEESEYDKDGSISRKEIYRYNTDGKKIEYSVYDSKGNLKSREEHFEYQNGRLIRYDETEFFSSGNSIDQYTLVYDAKGNLTKITCQDEKGEISRIETYVYNDHGDCVEQVTDYMSLFDTDRKIMSYEYDSRGNYTRKETTRNDGYKDLETRTIIYY